MLRVLKCCQKDALWNEEVASSKCSVLTVPVLQNSEYQFQGLNSCRIFLKFSSNFQLFRFKAVPLLNDH